MLTILRFIFNGFRTLIDLTITIFIIICTLHLEKNINDHYVLLLIQYGCLYLGAKISQPTIDFNNDIDEIDIVPAIINGIAYAIGFLIVTYNFAHFINII